MGWKFLLVLPGLLVSGAALAAQFIVGNNADSGTGSLRAAITAANAAGITGTPHTILFSTPFVDGSTITLTSALPVITVPLDISGNGREPILSGNEAFPLLRTTATRLSVEDMTLANGWTPAVDTTSGNGGCIQYIGASSVASSLFVIDAIFDNCRARQLRFASGGAIDWPSLDGYMLVARSVFLGNAAVSNNVASEQPRGGAIATNAALRVSKSEFIGNSVSAAGVRGGFGGAIASFVQPGSATEIDKSRFHGNSVTPSADTFGEGGAVYLLLNGDGIARVRGNWLRANSARIGGGVSVKGQSAAQLFVRNTTFHEGVVVNSGGGLSVRDVITDLAELTFARNSAPLGAGPHLDLGSIDLRRFSNIVLTPALSAGDPCRLSAVGQTQLIRVGNVFSTTCGGLESSGGVLFPAPPVFTVDESQTVGALLFPVGSPVIDGGDDAEGNCSDVDARDTQRPIDSNSDGVARCDAGAIEHVSPILFRNGFE